MAFKKPEKVVSGTKILIFGEAGTRKTRTALTFPRIAYIDSDQGSDNYHDEFAENIALVSDSTTFAEVVEDLDGIEEQLDNIDTIVLDSITKIYENQQHSALKVVEQRARQNNRLVEGEGLSPKEWGIIKLNHEKMISKFLEFKKDGKILITISEAKDEKEAVGNGQGGMVFRKVGITPNTVKGAEFDYDIVLEMVKGEDDTFLGAKVIKDRTGTVAEGEIIPNPSYEIWKDAIEKKRKTGKKVEKRDFDKDIDKDADVSFGNDIDRLKKELLSIVKELATDKQKELEVLLKKQFKTANFNTYTNAADLEKALELAKTL